MYIVQARVAYQRLPHSVSGLKNFDETKIFQCAGVKLWFNVKSEFKELKKYPKFSWIK
jgi:hypothetical protein